MPRRQPERTMPPGFWSQESTVKVLQLVLDGILTMQAAAVQLDAPFNRVEVYVGYLKRKKRIFSPDWAGYGTPGENVIVPLAYKDFGKVDIDWATFFALPRPQVFDLRVICAMFYASERIVTAKLRQPVPELADLRRRAQEYISTWALRFGKYTLAACLGEFRHRAISGALKLVPKGGRRVPREAAQYAAMLLWPDEEKTRRAAEWMTEKFADITYFTRPHAYGGRKWARIADTFLQWHVRKIPDIVFGDYVWDLSHNAGRFFDKCELLANEKEVRTLLDRKRMSKTGDVREWSGERRLHPDWLQGLNLIEVAEMPGPEEA